MREVPARAQDRRWHLPLVSLMALGTDDGVAVGHLAWDTDALGEAVCRWANATDSVWTHTSIAPGRGFIQRCTFEGWNPVAGSASASDSGLVAASAAGGLYTVTTSTYADASHPGILTLTGDATLQSRSGVRPSGGTGGGGVKLGASKPLISGCRFRFSVAPAAGDRFELYVGAMYDMASTAAPTGGAYVVRKSTSDNFLCRTGHASTNTDTDSAVPGTVNVARDAIVVATTASVRFFVQAENAAWALVATNTTNLPTGQLYWGSPWGLRTNAEAAAWDLIVDEIWAEQVAA